MEVVMPCLESAGNIRVYCRVRPIFNKEMNGVIDYIGKDGSLFVLDPSKPYKDARKTFQFNQVFGPTATQGNFAMSQRLHKLVLISLTLLLSSKISFKLFKPMCTDDVFRETQPLIRSVMDGYNVCIFAYGQTGSGKTYTMVRIVL